MQAEKTANNKSQRWEFGRFLKTAQFYNALTPKIPFLSATKRSDSIRMLPNDILWKSDDVNNKINVEWGPLDDVVMGGVSKSELEPGQKFNGIWKGFVTSANNGGFTGIRTKLFKQPLDATTSTGIVIKVKGDGNRYKFILRDDNDWNGVAWSTSFDTTKNSMKAIKLPFNSFKPTRFARVLDGDKKYNKKNMTAMQISLSKFEYDGGLNPKFKEGDFELTIDSIALY